MYLLILQTGEPLHIDNDGSRPMRAINLANKLVSNSHKVTILSSDFYHQKKIHRYKKFSKFKIKKNLEIHLIPSLGYKKNIGFARLIDHMILGLNLIKYLRENKSNLPDAVFIGYPPIETAFIAVNWFNKLNIPTILDIKDLWPTFFLEPFPKNTRSVIKFFLTPYFYLSQNLIRKSFALSAPTQGYLNWAYEFSGRTPSQSDTTNPLTNPVTNYSKEDLLEAENWWEKFGVNMNNKKRICFVGSFMTVFNFSSVLEAVECLSSKNIDCQFVFCGEGAELSKIQNMFLKHENVIFPGWINSTQYKFLSKCCSGAIIPYNDIENYKLNIPNKVIDSLALGLPFISTLSGVVDDLILNNKVGFSCNERTGLSISEAIEYLLENPSKQAQLSENCLKLYKKNFSYDFVYEKLIKKIKYLTSIKKSSN